MRCVYPDCPNTSSARGLCHGHYQTMRARVRAAMARPESEGGPFGLTLEEDLERRRLLLPKGEGASPASDTHGAFVLGSNVHGRSTY